jgi:heat shock protein HslJ/membrane-bound inhibitor of C-type lysozyme
MLSIRGRLAYRARIALPPESVAVVELRDVSSSDQPVIKEQRIVLGGKQVPIPFELTVDRNALVVSRQYNVRGVILARGKPIWATEPVLIDPRSISIDLGTLTMMPFRAQAFASTLRCGNQTVTVGYTADKMHLTLGKETIEMHPVVAASGAKYAAVGDPTTTLWSKGDRAMLVLRGQSFPECTRVSTQAEAFRATGNEPGWRLQITDAMITFIGDYGQTRFEAPTPAAETAAGFTQYAASSGRELIVRIFDRTCSDTMSGMPYPHEVTVMLDGKPLNGCGGDPAALLQGPEWVVEDINRAGIIDKSRVTLNFSPDRRISGRASCNTYTGGYKLTGETLTLSKTGVTMMACAPALMRQEDLFLHVLTNVNGFALASDGALILRAAGGQTITARRASP